MAETPQKKQALIIHDAYSHPSGHWYGWIKHSLVDLGIAVEVPDFPTPTGHTITYWDNVLEKEDITLTPATTLVGHGIGCAYLLSLVSRSETPVGDIFLVAPYVAPIDHIGFDRINQEFYQFPFDWAAIKNKVRSVSIFYSRKDPYVSEESILQLHQTLGGSISQINDGEHFNAPSGYRSFPELLTDIATRDTYVAPTAEEELTEELEQKGIDTEKISAAEERKRQKELQGLSTYYGDMSHAISHAEAKDMADLLKKQRHLREQADVRQSRRLVNALQISGAVILLLLGIFALTRLGSQDRIIEQSQVAIIPNFVTADVQSIVSLADLEPGPAAELVAATFAEESLEPGTLHEIIPTRTILGRQERLNPRNFVNTIETRTPALLKQDFGRSFMLGSYHNTTGKEPFLLIPISSLGRAQSALEDWQPAMPADLGTVFLIQEDLVAAAASGQYNEITKNNRTYYQLVAQRPITTEVSKLIPLDELMPEDLELGPPDTLEEPEGQVSETADSEEVLEEAEPAAEDSSEVEGGEESVEGDISEESVAAPSDETIEETVEVQAREPLQIDFVESTAVIQTYSTTTLAPAETVLVYGFLNEYLVITTDPIVLDILHTELTDAGNL